MKLKEMIGSGDKIILFTLPSLILGLVLNYLYPGIFSVNWAPKELKIISWFFLILGLVVWIYSVVLVLIKVPKQQLIINGPFAIVKHPIYTSVAILVLPWVGFLLDTWLGLAIGIILYTGSRIFSKKEEEILAENFGEAWKDYSRKVKLPWL